jgi:hypothetical protein
VCFETLLIYTDRWTLREFEAVLVLDVLLEIDKILELLLALVACEDMHSVPMLPQPLGIIELCRTFGTFRQVFSIVMLYEYFHTLERLLAFWAWDGNRNGGATVMSGQGSRTFKYRRAVTTSEFVALCEVAIEALQTIQRYCTFVAMEGVGLDVVERTSFGGLERRFAILTLKNMKMKLISVLL